MGFVVGIDNIAVTIHDHTQDIADPRCEVQVMVPLHGVQFHVEPKVIGSLPAPAGGSKLPLIKSRWDPFIGRRVRVIGQEKYKMFEGRIIKRMDNDDSKVEVQISAKLAFAKVPNIVVPLAHLSDWLNRNDVKNRPLLQVYNPVEVAQEPESQLPVLQLPPDNPLPPAMSSTAAGSTPAWTPSAGSSSTPAWNPSSRTPDPRGPQPDSF
ncbi:hypothetical protein H0H92_015431, partial [Tricholoma furcatifolium]